MSYSTLRTSERIAYHVSTSLVNSKASREQEEPHAIQAGPRAATKNNLDEMERLVSKSYIMQSTAELPII